MNDQRMVDVGLLEEAIKTMCDLCTNDSMPAVGLLEEKLRAIISGPGVEPVAYLYKVLTIGKGLSTEFAAIEYHLQDGEKLIWKKPLYLAAPSAPVPEWPVLDKPALVGGGRFHVGVSSRLVVEAAQRHYEYEVTPEKEAERIARSAKAINALTAPVQTVPDGWIDDAMALAHRWALACYYKGLNKPYEDIDRIRGELRAMLAAPSAPVQAVPDGELEQWRKAADVLLSGRPLTNYERRDAARFLQDAYLLHRAAPQPPKEIGE